MTESGRPTDAVAGLHTGQPLRTAGAPALAADAALICCHGRGATAQGVINLMDPASRHGVAVLAPQAERSRWYPHPSTAPRADNEPWLSSSVDRIGLALERARAIDVPPERTVLAGFSQGACVAAEFVRRTPTRYGGLAVLSGLLPGSAAEIRSTAIDGSLEGTPVLVGYGDADPHVESEHIAETIRVFEEGDTAVDERCYPDTGHEVTADEFTAIGAMLERVLDE
ncbi:alpha/beta hydrolase [Natrinema ejinorense]|uniref:Phospholipase n=1 Tax=Natrinema ejinorense TaxID=373386 RepID=A0A2A5QVE0_9EURY|nr:PHB depolymerase family esterase [Natrinema ejinorense]PCR90719.1 phospholipase [Natrinema ejinorense]